MSSDMKQRQTVMKLARSQIEYINSASDPYAAARTVARQVHGLTDEHGAPGSEEDRHRLASTIIEHFGTSRPTVLRESNNKEYLAFVAYLKTLLG